MHGVITANVDHVITKMSPFWIYIKINTYYKKRKKLFLTCLGFQINNYKGGVFYGEPYSCIFLQGSLGVQELKKPCSEVTFIFDVYFWRCAWYNF